MPRRFRTPHRNPLVRILGSIPLIALIWVLSPSVAQAALHGAAIAKGCQPKQSCATNADCADANSCNGLGICSSGPGDNVTECSVQVTNSDGFGDTLSVISAQDRVKPGALDEVVITPLSIIAVSGTTTCTVGGSLPCNIGPAASVTFLSNQYVIQPTDPDPLPDQAESQFMDLCNGTPDPSCSGSVNLLQASSQTDLTTGCGPGPTCTPGPTVTPTPTDTPTNTPTDTPSEGPPPPTVPTLSFPMMALFGLILAGAGLFLARRQ